MLFVRSVCECARFVGYRSASVLSASVLDRSATVAGDSMRCWIGCEGLRCSFGGSSPMLWQAVLCCGGVGVSIGAGTAKNAGKLAPAFSAFVGALGALGFIVSLGVAVRWRVILLRCRRRWLFRLVCL